MVHWEHLQDFRPQSFRQSQYRYSLHGNVFLQTKNIVFYIANIMLPNEVLQQGKMYICEAFYHIDRFDLKVQILKFLNLLTRGLIRYFGYILIKVILYQIINECRRQ